MQIDAYMRLGNFFKKIKLLLTSGEHKVDNIFNSSRQYDFICYL